MVALVVAWSGGFREAYGEVRVTLTSWPRVALFACAVAIARHAAWPIPILPVRLRAGLRRAYASPVVRTVAPAVQSFASGRRR